MSTDTDFPVELADQVALVMATLQAVVDEAGHDFRYDMRPDTFAGMGTACFYVNPETNEPDCIVGRVLYRLGVPLDVLRTNDLAGNPTCTVGRFSLEGSPVQLDDRILGLLRAAQQTQDRHAPWGECLEEAKGYAQRILGWQQP